MGEKRKEAAAPASVNGLSSKNTNNALAARQTKRKGSRSPMRMSPGSTNTVASPTGQSSTLRSPTRASTESADADVLTAGQAPKLKAANRKREWEFKVAHGYLVGFFTIIIILHVFGIYLFTSGFLLTRLVLNNQSECSVPPIESLDLHIAGSVADGCWHPKKFEKAVILIIDALRYDFTVPFETSKDTPRPRHYHNALPILYETALQEPQNAFLRPFIADPPTTTLQRLKGLMTGTLPTFIEGGSNFAADSIEEDTLISQLAAAKKTIVQLGDDTWQSLFPHHFDPVLTKPFDSFNVPDLHTVDNGVITHLMPLLHSSNSSKWDVIIGHGLGVDHVGHNFGPDHPEMPAKLRQMNDMVKQTMSLIDDNTLLVVMGDHGMDSKGNHGGESDDEVEAALWMYSKKAAFGRSDARFFTPPSTAKDRPVPQIDLVPTLALLLGLPIPFNNLGAPIEEAFIGSKGEAWENVAVANRLTAAQIHRFQQAYSLVRAPDPDALALPDILWHAANSDWKKHTEHADRLSNGRWIALAGAFSSYQRQNLDMFRSLWARFDVLSMAMGVGVLLMTMAVMIMFAHGIDGDTTQLHSRLVRTGTVTLLAGGIGGGILGNAIPSLGLERTAAFSASTTCCIILLYTLMASQQRKSFPFPTNLWSWMCFIFVLLLAGGFGSNSYTVWEEESLLFILAALGTVLLAAAYSIKDKQDRVFASCHIVIFLVMLRTASFARICREEQMPNCSPLFYASSSSTTSSGWRLLIPYVVAIVLPSAIHIYLDRTASWQGSAPLWIGIVFRTALFGIAAVWTLDAVESPILFISVKTLTTVRVAIAQLILMAAVGAGGSTFAWMPPLLGVERSASPTTGNPQLVVSGTRNLYGSHFSMLPFTILTIPLLVLSKPMGQLSLFCITIAIFSLLELLALIRGQTLIDQKAKTSPTPPSALSSLAPVLLALLGHFIYFKTGHQAALASIQWDSAFIPLKTNRLPWSAIFVILNTFAGQILTAAAVPAVVLWRRPFNFKNENENQKPGAKSSISASISASVSSSSNSTSSPNSTTISNESQRNAILSDLAKALMTHFLVYTIINFATTVFAAHLRRHLMLYRVFCPRWMLGSVGMIIAEIAGTFIGIGGVASTVGSLGGLFGW